MKIKYLTSLVTILLLISITLPAKMLATSWAYQFVVWDGYIYVVSNDEYVTEIDKEIGQVTRYSDMKQYPGNFSNAYAKGTNYYSIKGISTDEAIAIEVNDGQYKKAVRGAQYTYTDSKSSSFRLEIGLLLIALIALGGYFVRKRVSA